MLYGDGETEAKPDTVQKLCEELLQTDLLLLFLNYMPDLEFEVQLSNAPKMPVVTGWIHHRHGRMSRKSIILFCDNKSKQQWTMSPLILKFSKLW